MRLIDADKIDFNKVLLGESKLAQNTRKVAQMLIDAQPTAYDVDKVVEELEKESYRIDDSATLSIRDVIDIDDAIEIVGHGYVCDDCCEWRYNDTEYCLESSCNHLQIFMDDCPKQNEYSFCPYCGKKIKVVE